MSLDETNAYNALNQLIMPQSNSQSPLKNAPQMDESMLKMLQSLPIFNGMEGMEQAQTQQDDGKVFKESDSDSSGESARHSESPESDNTEQTVKDALKSSGVVRQVEWFECFTTTSRAEFEALIYSVYVIEKDEKKMDGWRYFECINRLQNKCRYKIRVKQQDEFFIVEEKCGHNHGIEPVGQAGSHAGLPKTIREIVDKSFNEEWPQNLRSHKIAEEITRLGLPQNPRLNRQVDNRVAYLRRVKNLNETKKIQDNLMQPQGDMLNAQMLQMLIEQQQQQQQQQMQMQAQEHQMNMEAAKQQHQLQQSQPIIPEPVMSPEMIEQMLKSLNEQSHSMIPSGPPPPPQPSEQPHQSADVQPTQFTENPVDVAQRMDTSAPIQLENQTGLDMSQITSLLSQAGVPGANPIMDTNALLNSLLSQGLNVQLSPQKKF